MIRGTRGIRALSRVPFTRAVCPRSRDTRVPRHNTLGAYSIIIVEKSFGARSVFAGVFVCKCVTLSQFCIDARARA